jgi:hypothetical protein
MPSPCANGTPSCTVDSNLSRAIFYGELGSARMTVRAPDMRHGSPRWRVEHGLAVCPGAALDLAISLSTERAW